MATTRTQLYRPRISVEIDGLSEPLPAIRFHSSFELNAIPSGSVSVALGDEFFSGDPSPVHALADDLAARRRRCRVLLDMRPEGDSGGPTLPDGEFLAFDGWTGQVGYAEANGSAQYDIALAHWLDDMDFSSVFSKTSHPGNPGDYTFGALSNGGAVPAGGGPAAPAGRHWLGLTHGLQHFTIANVESDLWLSAIRPWFRALCSLDGFWAKERGLRGKGANDAALASLGRMGAGKGYVPLSLDLGNLTDGDIGRLIADDATEMTQDPEENAHITIWGALVGKFAPEYLFAVVPLVDRAMVVPFTPGYRTPYLAVPPTHNMQVEWTRTINRPLMGVGVLAGMDADTRPGLGAPGSPLSAMGIGGYYTPGPDAEGQVMILEGPRWVGSLFAASEYGDEAAGADGAPIPDAHVPDVHRIGHDPAVRARAVGIKSFLDRYAQGLYALEMIKGRQAVAAGPARFDVAPGSTLLISPSGRPGDDRLAAPFYATVLRVSTAVDAEGGRCGTGFHLSHCRSEGENGSDRTSVGKHPLYRNTFSGCALVD